LDAALDFTYWATYEYAPTHFYDEMRGIADGEISLKILAP
jgi:hypothetical protein